jgi:predicted  nucleic acid-binding Zn-ribbon protein
VPTADANDTEDLMAKRKKMTELERAVHSRELGIRKMEDEIMRIQSRSEMQIADIRKRIASKKILLDAIKRGALEP